MFTDVGAVYISLADYNATNPGSQVFTANPILQDQSNVIIHITNVLKRDIKFFVIQVHSFQVDVVLSNNINFMPNTYVNGTNIGLVQIVTGASDYQFFVKNKYIQFNNTVLIAVVPYGAGI